MTRTHMRTAHLDEAVLRWVTQHASDCRGLGMHLVYVDQYRVAEGMNKQARRNEQLSWSQVVRSLRRLTKAGKLGRDRTGWYVTRAPK